MLRSGRLALGPMIDRFERAVADRTGAPFAAAVSSGTPGFISASASLASGPATRRSPRRSPSLRRPTA